MLSTRQRENDTSGIKNNPCLGSYCDPLSTGSTGVRSMSGDGTARLWHFDIQSSDHVRYDVLGCVRGVGRTVKDRSAIFGFRRDLLVVRRQSIINYRTCICESRRDVDLQRIHSYVRELHIFHARSYRACSRRERALFRPLSEAHIARQESERRAEPCWKRWRYRRSPAGGNGREA